jgi:hypothetical protein
MLEDVEKIGRLVGRNKIVETPADIYFQWDFQFYLLRYYDTQLSPKPNSDAQYVLARKDKVPENETNCEKVSIELNNYSLYKKRN